VLRSVAAGCQYVGKISVDGCIARYAISLPHPCCAGCGAATNIEFGDLPFVASRLIDHLESVSVAVSHSTVVPGFRKTQTVFQRQSFAQRDAEIAEGKVRSPLMRIPTGRDVSLIK